jgi:hypothetical protein
MDPTEEAFMSQDGIDDFSGRLQEQCKTWGRTYSALFGLLRENALSDPAGHSKTANSFCTGMLKVCNAPAAEQRFFDDGIYYKGRLFNETVAPQLKTHLAWFPKVFFVGASSTFLPTVDSLSEAMEPLTSYFNRRLAILSVSDTQTTFKLPKAEKLPAVLDSTTILLLLLLHSYTHTPIHPYTIHSYTHTPTLPTAGGGMRAGAQGEQEVQEEGLQGEMMRI